MDNYSISFGPLRARCDACEHRFPWPTDAPPTVIEPLIRPEISCPSCHRVGPLIEEPHDENWWACLTISDVGDTDPVAVTVPKPKKTVTPVIGGSIE